MILTNYHTHTTFCDGKTDPEFFAEAAVEKGFKALGFSTHAPAPGQESWTIDPRQVAVYLKSVDDLKERYDGRLEIYSGFEIDFIPGWPESDAGIRGPEIDYVIGGLHIVQVPGTEQFPTIDGPSEEFLTILNAIFDGNHKKFALHYYSLLREMLKETEMDIIAHFDLIKVRNRGEEHYSEHESWYQDTVSETLEAVFEAGAILEINTGGVKRRKADCFYPSRWILEQACGMGIPTTISADAHNPGDIDCMYQEATEWARHAGYSEKRVLLNGRWQDVPL